MRVGRLSWAAVSLAGMLGTMVCGGAGALAQAGEKAPAVRLALSCEQPVFDFGESFPDRVIAHSFVLQNNGTNPVQILNVRSGCGCTTTAVKTNLLGPGESTDLMVNLDLKGRKGPQRKPIYVESDDPNAACLRLEMKGVVNPPIDARPEGMHFGTLARDGAVEREVLLVARTNVTFHVKTVRPSSSGFAAQVETKEDGKVYNVKIQSLGPRLGGTSYAMVQVETDLPEMPFVSIPVVAFVASDIVAAPATLMLVQGPTNEARTYYVGLSTPAGQPFKVIKVEPPPPGVTCKVVTVAPDRQRLEIKVAGWLGDLNGKSLRIETDLEAMREVRVPLRVIAGPGAPEKPAQP